VAHICQHAVGPPQKTQNPTCCLQGFLVNLDLQKDIWQKGFNALAASAAPGGAAGAAAAAASARSKAVLEYGHYSLVMTEPLFNFESVRAATEEVRCGSCHTGIPHTPACLSCACSNTRWCWHAKQQCLCNTHDCVALAYDPCVVLCCALCL
jgi:hypothetical protein